MNTIYISANYEYLFNHLLKFYNFSDRIINTIYESYESYIYMIYFHS